MIRTMSITLSVRDSKEVKKVLEKGGVDVVEEFF
jgi:hypothetical protein